MKYIVGAGTNIGIKKSTNQDSYTIKQASAGPMQIAMCIICDGMGGLEKGEVASAHIISHFSNWFMRELPQIINEDNIIEVVRKKWNSQLLLMNDQLNEYGRQNSCMLGSTITGVLLLNDKYLIVNVGDSRTYLLNNSIKQLTEDQSLVALEVKNGKITIEQAAVDPRKNVLLQCIGAVDNLEVVFYTGSLKSGEALLLCSDGFRHQVTEQEILDILFPARISNEEMINDGIEKLIQLNMSRNETDNITAIMIKSN